MRSVMPSASRSIRSPAGRPATRSANRRAGTVSVPSLSILPGTQAVIPISRLVAVSLRPASSVRNRTFASTGSVLRLLTARLTVCSPRARFSCIRESFTSLGSLQNWPLAGYRRPGRQGPAGSVDDGCLFLSSHSIVIIRGVDVGENAFFVLPDHSKTRPRRWMNPAPWVDGVCGSAAGDFHIPREYSTQTSHLCTVRRELAHGIYA